MKVTMPCASGLPPLPGSFVNLLEGKLEDSRRQEEQTRIRLDDCKELNRRIKERNDALNAKLREQRQRAINVSKAHKLEKQILKNAHNQTLQSITDEWLGKLFQAHQTNRLLSVNVSEKAMTCDNLRDKSRNNIILPHALFGVISGCLILMLLIIIALLIRHLFKRSKGGNKKKRNVQMNQMPKQTKDCAINAKSFKWWPSITMTQEGKEGNQDLFDEGDEDGGGEELYGHTTKTKKNKLNDDLIKELELTMKMKE